MRVNASMQLVQPESGTQVVVTCIDTATAALLKSCSAGSNAWSLLYSMKSAASNPWMHGHAVKGHSDSMLLGARDVHSTRSCGRGCLQSGSTDKGSPLSGKPSGEWR